jgi:hypothetical protein
MLKNANSTHAKRRSSDQRRSENINEKSLPQKMPYDSKPSDFRSFIKLRLFIPYHQDLPF